MNQRDHDRPDDSRLPDPATDESAIEETAMGRRDDGAGAEPGCEDAVGQLYAYLDGELDHGTVVRVEAHLRRCSPCLEAYDFTAELKRVVASKCSESMPADVRAKLLGMFSDPPT